MHQIQHRVLNRHSLVSEVQKSLAILSDVITILSHQLRRWTYTRTMSSTYYFLHLKYTQLATKLSDCTDSPTQNDIKQKRAISWKKIENHEDHQCTILHSAIKTLKKVKINSRIEDSFTHGNQRVGIYEVYPSLEEGWRFLQLYGWKFAPLSASKVSSKQLQFKYRVKYAMIQNG